MMQAVMLSRPNLEKVAQKTDLMLDAKTRREQEAVIDSLAKRIQLGRPTGPGTQNTFVVSFEDNDPEGGAPRRAHPARYVHGRQPGPQAHRMPASRSASWSRRSRNTSRS